MGCRHFFHVTRPTADRQQVEAWSGYPLQFAGQRRFPWQEQMALELRAALGELAIAPGQALAGVYQSTEDAGCDTENRLFTNPGPSSFPKAITSIRFERGTGQPPRAPVPIFSQAGHLHYYRYRPGGRWEWWQPAEVLARWHRVPRRLPDDGSCRPVWLAMKQAAVTGQIVASPTALEKAVAFGVRVVVHATPRGPRSAPAISERLLDGTIAAFHAGVDNAASAAAAAAALASKLPGVSSGDLQMLVAMNAPGPFFGTPPFVIKGSYVQISPCDERCQAARLRSGPMPRAGTPKSAVSCSPCAR